VLRHRCGSHQAWSATLAGCGRVLAHASDWSNRLAGIPAEKSCAFCGRGVPFSSVEVSVRGNSLDKVVAACDRPVSVWFPRAKQRRTSGFTVY
jgi:hypothetical protein